MFCNLGPYIPLLSIKNTPRHIENPVKHQQQSFLPKQLTAFSRQLISKKSSIIDVQLGSKHTNNTSRGVLFFVKIIQKIELLCKYF